MFLKLVSTIAIAKPRVRASWSSIKGKFWFVMGVSGMHFSMPSTGQKMTRVSPARISGPAWENQRLMVFTGSHWVVGSVEIDHNHIIRNNYLRIHFVVFFWLFVLVCRFWDLFFFCLFFSIGFCLEGRGRRWSFLQSRVISRETDVTGAWISVLIRRDLNLFQSFWSRFIYQIRAFLKRFLRSSGIGSPPGPPTDRQDNQNFDLEINNVSSVSSCKCGQSWVKKSESQKPLTNLEFSEAKNWLNLTELIHENWSIVFYLLNNLALYIRNNFIRVIAILFRLAYLTHEPNCKELSFML